MRSGMRKEAVQNERDRIRRNSVCSIRDDSILNVLLSSEAIVRQLRSSVITRTVDAHRQATTGDVTDSMNQQLIYMVEWAKNLHSFQRLPINTQAALLRNFSAQHLVMSAAFRSIHVNDAVYLTNETCLPRYSPKVPDINRVAAKIVDHLTTPMRRLQIRETEYVALKAIVLFDPMVKGVQDSFGDIDETRQKVLESFEKYILQVSPVRDARRRFANLLLLLPPLLAISRDLVEDVQLAKLFGLASIDELMQELLLPPDSTTVVEKIP